MQTLLGAASETNCTSWFSYPRVIQNFTMYNTHHYNLLCVSLPCSFFLLLFVSESLKRKRKTGCFFWNNGEGSQDITELQTDSFLQVCFCSHISGLRLQ